MMKVSGNQIKFSNTLKSIIDYMIRIKSTIYRVSLFVNIYRSGLWLSQNLTL
jgi:hypothetical protein